MAKTSQPHLSYMFSSSLITNHAYIWSRIYSVYLVCLCLYGLYVVPKGILRNKTVILPLGFLINWSLRQFILELLDINYVLK